MKKLDIRLERGDHGRLEDLHARVVAAVEASGVEADVRKGAAAGGMTVHGAPTMTVGGARVADPEAMTAAGLARLLRLAAEGALAGDRLALPFAERFRELGESARVLGADVRAVTDDATGAVYLACGGALSPLLRADGTPERMA